MNRSSKIVYASIGTLLVLSVAIYGNFLPLRKSQILIYALRNLNESKSLEEFKNNLAVPLGFPSPIGQEETVRNVANIVVNVVQQTDKPEDISYAINFIEGYYKPIIDRGVGMSFEQNIYILGTLNELAFMKTKEVKYLSAAHDYFEQGLLLGPKRPQFLYGMFDVYRIEGNIAGVQAVAQQILAQWPRDERVKSAFADFMKKVSSSTVEKK
ncbi:MAG: hypothetical protein A3B25_03340 [Candidatus Ryanbacteria bacterium RIFCSPLOWO2_01_FULL_48_26]|uniref:Tetratricopeptide repeat-like domain-containing protein n=1 Tax=Candidatus Ryanbacteria bacterium RIFCSPLOWO2_01_FULL_48_26 TaxID=1802126 RepID=A0A1G2GSK0_9BACT|nr:MAG: hypothetical protein A3B25_03340 [Candidatus Ryanbacteria bacterium RIFCSPLOWO2_01_FULL_48_26]